MGQPKGTGTRDGLYKRGAIWWVRKDPLTGKAQSTGCRDKRNANAWRANRERLAADPTSHNPISPATIGDCLARLLDLTTRERSESTAEVVRQKAAQWIAALGDGFLADEVTPQIVDRYVLKRKADGVTNLTITKEVQVMLRALRLAKRVGEFNGDLEALRPVDLRAGYKPRKRALTLEEVAALLGALDGWRRPWVALAVSFGLRASEVDGLTHDCWNPLTGVLTVHGTKTDGSDREVSALSVFAAWWPEGVAGIPTRSWGNRLRDLSRACRRAKIEVCTPNDLRRTFATTLIALGVDRDVVRRFMGHKTSRMVDMVYGRPSTGSLAQLAEMNLSQTLQIRDSAQREAGAESVSVENLRAASGTRTPDLRFTNPHVAPALPPRKATSAGESSARGSMENHGEPWSVAGDRNNDATVPGTASPSTWSLAYAYRDVLSRRAVA